MEVEKGVVVRDPLLLIVNGSEYAILSHNTFSSWASALLCLHQLVYLGVAGWTDTRRQKEEGVKEKQEHHKTWQEWECGFGLPGVESAEEEDDQTDNTLSIPPLHLLWDAVARCLWGADIWN